MNDQQNQSQNGQRQNVAKIKVCSFEDMQTEGAVELHIDKPSKFRDPRLMVRSFYDSDDDTHWGIVSKVDQNGEVEFLPIVLDGDVVRYNLANAREAKIFHIIRNSPWVRGSKMAMRNGGIDIKYKIYDINREAEVAIAKIEQSQTAIGWIRDLDEYMLKGLARVYGLSPETNSIAVIKRALLEKAQNKPESILAKKDKMSETNILIMLKRAVAMQVVKEIPGIGFKYENQTLGINDNIAVEYLRTHPEVAVAIDELSKEAEGRGTGAKKDISGGSAPVTRGTRLWEKPKPAPANEDNFSS